MAYDAALNAAETRNALALVLTSPNALAALPSHALAAAVETLGDHCRETGEDWTKQPWAAWFMGYRIDAASLTSVNAAYAAYRAADALGRPRHCRDTLGLAAAMRRADDDGRTFTGWGAFALAWIAAADAASAREDAA